MATHVGIIHKGKMLFQGTLHDLQQMKTRQTLLEIETSNNVRAAELLQQQFGAVQKENKIIVPFQNKEQTAAINKLLVQQDIDVYALHPQQNDLEQLFIDITSDKI